METQIITVARVAPFRMGSFINVEAEDGRVFTLGLGGGPDPIRPATGQMVRVTGVVRAGVFNTDSWAVIRKRFIVIGGNPLGGEFGIGASLSTAELRFKKAGGDLAGRVRRFRFTSELSFAPSHRSALANEADAYVDGAGGVCWIRCERDEFEPRK